MKEKDVSVELKKGNLLLCCEWNSFRFIWAGKAVQDCVRRWMMVPGIGGRFWLFEDD